MRKEDIEHINHLIGVETVELGARKEQLQVLVERTSRALKDMDDEAAAREAAKARAPRTHAQSLRDEGSLSIVRCAFCSWHASLWQRRRSISRTRLAASCKQRSWSSRPA